MSHYADLKIANNAVWSMQNTAHPFVMELFTKDERRVYTTIEDHEEHHIFEYQSTVGKFIQRLEILGYSLGKARHSFDAGIEKLQQEMNLTDSERQTFAKFDFGTWQKCMRAIIMNGLTKWNIHELLSAIGVAENLHPYIFFILGKYIFEESGNEPEYYFVGSFELGFSIYGDQYYGRSYSPCAEVHDLFRAISGVFDVSESVKFDYSSLISWGTYNEEEDITEEPGKIIILTEGSTDREFLERTLNILHPDLSKYYFFLEFHSSNLQGGASSVIHLIKGFVGARIFNKTIAILDNDTAAFDAMRSLRDVALPETIRILTLPRLNLAESYPTIGPQGNIKVDINGLACGIEIYFGTAILSNGQDELTPIQWTGYNTALGQYNGEIINKKEIQEKYRAQLDNIEKGKIEINECDWSGMEAIFQTLFSAFSNDRL